MQFIKTPLGVATLGAAFAIPTPPVLLPISTNSTRLEARHDADRYGIATVYDQNGVAGSCGQYNSDDSLIVAVSPAQAVWACGRKVKISNNGPSTDMSIGGQGNEVWATVADKCPGCDDNHLDLSRGAWNQLTNAAFPSQVGIKWYFYAPDGNCD